MGCYLYAVKHHCSHLAMLMIKHAVELKSFGQDDLLFLQQNILDDHKYFVYGLVLFCQIESNWFLLNDSHIILIIFHYFYFCIYAYLLIVDQS